MSEDYRQECFACNKKCDCECCLPSSDDVWQLEPCGYHTEYQWMCGKCFDSMSKEELANTVCLMCGEK